MEQKKSAGKAIREAFVASIPVMAGYVFLGIGFGILLRQKGFGPVWALLMSTCIFAGSMQYVLIDLMATGASLITVLFTTLAVNARHLFYGISMIEKYKDQKKRPYLIFALTDETYSINCTKEAEERNRENGNYYFLVSFFDQIYWVTGSLIGSILGANLPFNPEGIDFALTAMFVTIFVEQWLSVKDHTAALVGVGSSLVCLFLIGPDQFLIPTMLLIALLLVALRKKEGITNE